MTDLAEATEAQLARALAAKRKARRAPAKRARAVSVNDPASKMNGEPGAGTKRGHISLTNIERLQKRQGDRCAHCPTRLGTYTDAGELHIVGFHVDHDIPLALGGSDALTNWQLLCVPCHRAKTKLDVAQIAKAKRQAKLLKPREPSKRPLRSRGFAK